MRNFFRFFVVSVFTFVFLKVSFVLAFEKINSFDVEIKIEKDSSFLVKEKIVYDFGRRLRHGIYRDIPLSGIEIIPLKVEDEKGNPLKYKVFKKGNYLRFKIGDPEKLVKGVHTYVIFYKVKFGILFWEDYDELYWNVTGNEWEVRIKKARAEVFLPQKVKKEDLRFLCFTGKAGSKESFCKIYQKDQSVIFETQETLFPYEGFTISLAFPKGVVKKPSKGEIFLFHLKRKYPLLFPIVLFFYLFYEWYRNGKDPKIKKPIVPQYEAPENLSPAEMLTLLKQKFLPQAISASLINLAVKGYIKIIEEEREGLIFKKREIFFRRTKKEIKDDLSLMEKALLRYLFEAGTSVVSLETLKNYFYRRISSLKNKTYHTLMKKRFFVKRPDKVRQKWQGFSLALFFAGFIFGGFIFHSFLVFLSLIISALISFFFSFFMPKRTKKGTDVCWKILGFKEYLETAEKYRARFYEKANIFEKFLPYAIAFGIAQKWAKAFEGIYENPPSWYEGPSFSGRFSPSSFSESLQTSFLSQVSGIFSAPGGKGSAFSGGAFGGGGASGYRGGFD